MKHTGPILSAMLLLAWTSAAAAECAWVLWTETKEQYGIDKLPVEWDIGEAYGSQEACNVVRTQQWENTLSTYQTLPESRLLKNPGRSLTIYFPADILPPGHRTHTFHCLPDTIDPREKKE